MNRIEARFADLKARDEKALVAFLTAGDPLPDNTADLIEAIAAGGADIIELGVPFSDPLADGPVIQASSFRALTAGMTPPKVLAAVAEARRRGVPTPIILMGAWNPALQYGPERFANACIEAGVDGTIMTDLSPEEAGEWKRLSDAAGLATVFLLAPTSTMARMALVGRLASGFIYCVSMTGITGTADVDAAALPNLLHQIRERANGIPVSVGFGIKNPEQVRAICSLDGADGAVVGTALVAFLHQNREAPDLVEKTKTYVADLKAATR
ncbi:MAG: tryptophan synthase subunit alpha [Armatimonas sp.]